MGQKVISNLQRYRINKMPWVDKVMQKGLGQRSLQEYLWSTGKVHSLFLREHSDWTQFNIKELRILLITMIHEWIREHRKQIIEEFEKTLAKMTPEDQKARKLRSQLTFSVSKRCE